jgi:hypothetical protein
MSNFPTDYDDDTTLPIVNNNITEIGAEAINALREAVFNIEQEVGKGGSGSSGTIAARLGVSILPDGTINPSAVTSLGLVTLPITNSQISNTAAIPESKLVLDHATQDLYNYILDLSANVNASAGWISSTGIKLEPHLVGVIYRHTLSHVDVSTDSAQYLKNKFENLRNNTNSYTLIDDINNELLDHQFSDGSPVGNIQNITTFNGSVYPSNYGHTASGIFLNTARFSTIPQTAQDVQSFAQFIDSSSIFLYGTRIQNLYTNGVSRVSRSSSLSTDGYGAPIVPTTPAIAYLLNTGSNSAPFDDINTGDDIIELKPSAGDLANNSFDEKFALVKVGDIIRINYGSIEVGFVIKEKKYIQNGGNKKFIIRIAGKNLTYTTTAFARIDRPLYNNNKFGVLAIAPANNEFSETPSLIIGSPTGAMALGNGFNPDQLDATHYLLYLALYPTGHAEDGYVVMPGIDITGNMGVTPGQYTLESVVDATNNSLRSAGYNYRFIAYSYFGNFGIMLADSYNNAGFSIINAVVDSNGSFDQTETNINFPNNVVDVFTTVNNALIDPCGLGVTGANIASPLYQTTYLTPEAAIVATKLFIPLRRNNYYVNGGERDKLSLDIGQTLDGYGDGYWFATITDQNVYPGPTPVGRVQTTYRVMLDLSTSGLKVGKTLVVQGFGQSTVTDYGRFIIQDINFGCYPNVYTDITVFDAVHGTGFSPTDTLPIGSEVGLYFNYDSVSFNSESATDSTSVSPFKRLFEVYVDLEGKTFTHERARINASASNLVINGSVPLYGSSELSKLEIMKVSSKLRGYQFGTVNKITLLITEYDSATGVFSGRLSYYDGATHTKLGPTASGKRGEIVRFYDETNVDYVDLMFDINTTVFNFSDQLLDIQLFPTLSLDEEIMILATCQLNDSTNMISRIRDQRQFGNTSEKDFSTSALNYISAPERFLHANGVVRGFDLDTTVTNPNNGQFFISGGVALVNGNFVDINPQTVTIPLIKEISGILYDINWAVCVNEIGEIQNIPLLDYDDTLPTPTNESRLFNAYNVVSGTTYILDSVIFIDLITKRKDLTVLYLVTSRVTSPSISITLNVSDIRKFVYNESENISLTWVPGKDDAQDVSGHFQTVDSVINWVNKFGSRNDVIKVRGNFSFTNTQDFTNINRHVTLLGDGATFNVYDSTGFFVKSNVTFDNITFNYNPSAFPVTGNINSDTGCILGRTYDVDGKIYNITVRNCQFNSSVPQHPPYISFRIAGGEYVDSVQIINNKFNDETSDHDAAIAFVGTETDYFQPYPSLISNILVENNHCYQNQAFYFVNSYSVSGNSFSIPGTTAVNVKIHNNKVGYIGYTISGNDKFNSDIIGQQLFSIEKNELIAIVGPLDETGKNPSIQSGNLGFGGATGPGLPSGNVVITDNDLNFITCDARTGRALADYALVDGYVGHLVITNNRLFAQNYTTKVFDIFGTIPWSSYFTSDNVAIAVSSRYYNEFNEAATGSIITNNIIQGSVIDDVFYGYGGGIKTSQSSLISGNTIKGLANVQNSGTDYSFGILVDRLIAADDAYSKIHHNSIYRNGNALSAYVYCLAHTAEVTDNFFDSSYISGSDENVVLFIPDFLTPNTNGMVVDRNKNQIITTALHGTDWHITVNGYDMGSCNATDLYASVLGWGAKRTLLRDSYDTALSQSDSAIALSTTGSSNFTVNAVLSLKDKLPKGVKLLSGSVRVVSDTQSGSNTMSLVFVRKKTHAGTTNTFLDSTTFSSPYVINTIVPLSVNLSAEEWVIEPSEMFNLAYLSFNGVSVSSSIVSIDCVILKYKW